MEYAAYTADPTPSMPPHNLAHYLSNAAWKIDLVNGITATICPQGMAAAAIVS